MSEGMTIIVEEAVVIEEKVITEVVGVVIAAVDGINDLQ